MTPWSKGSIHEFIVCFC